MSDTLGQNYAKLNEKYQITKEALKLACDYVRDEWERTGLEDKARKLGGFENYFIEQAKQARRKK